ncbi:RNI-like protein [Favolaschia claudopus]|uniref:RNI-like protein n=1 Tax=Favolaschia claudopus TaxID=2862362 RepID=A0AAW0EIQ5_9AGAR
MAAPIVDFSQYDMVLMYARSILRQRKEQRRELELLRQRQQKEFDLILQQPHKNDAIASETQGEWLGQEGDPVSLDGPMALPMPVEIGSDNDFKDVFQFLQSNLDPKDVLAAENQSMRDELTSTLGMKPGHEIKWNTPMVEFKRGVVYDDGRLDLCKMVVGPTHIEKLLDALERNTVITRFLLGNNVMSTTGARRIARFIEDHPNRIDTWYIAGNHVRAPGFQLLVDAMVNSPRITNIWLKRNPLTPASVNNVIRLITQTPNLRTLDLENTELGDSGVVTIMNEITGRDLPMRNIYLNANGIGERASIAIAGYLAHPNCKLESLYLGSNPVGDAGVLPMAKALESNTSLLRLSMTSTGLTSKGVSALCSALSTHPRIMFLDLSHSQTTRVHRQRFNHMADIAIPAIISLMKNPTMRHLNLGRTSFSAEGLETIKGTVAESNLCEYHAFRKLDRGEAMSCPLATRRALENNVKQFYPAEGSYDHFSNSLAARFLYSPEDVRLIDSVYRTRDKRGDKEIVQFWEEGDPVWQLVDNDV